MSTKKKAAVRKPRKKQEAVAEAANNVAKCHQTKEACAKATQKAKECLQRCEDAETAAQNALNKAHEDLKEVSRNYR